MSLEMTMEWILGVEIDGEWEHCRFSESQQALQTFAALASDYPGELHRAVLLRSALVPRLRPAAAQMIQ